MKKESVDSKVFFYFASLLVTLNTQKNYTRPLAFAILSCICHVLNFKGWDSSQKVSAGHQRSGTLKDSVLQTSQENASSLYLEISSYCGNNRLI